MKMKAYVRQDQSDKEVYLMDVNIPEMKSNQVRIKVHAFGVGVHDRYYIPENASFPYVTGLEGAGEITEIGSQVKDYAVGDRVIFTSSLQPQGGSWAEYAVANTSELLALPDTLSFAQGAAIPVPGRTALTCMQNLNLKNGDTLFISGASGAVGTILVQLAVAHGIQLSASASAKNQDYLKTLGVENPVDYNDPEWLQKVIKWSNSGVTAALCIPYGTAIESVKVVKDNGKLITISGDNTLVPETRNIKIKQLEHSEVLQQKVLDLIKEIASEKYKVIIEKEYSFQEAIKALEKTETKHATGKSVVTL